MFNKYNSDYNRTGLFLFVGIGSPFSGLLTIPTLLDVNGSGGLFIRSSSLELFAAAIFTKGYDR